ncbi:MAG: TonB family protein [Treponema sp.]|jgi:protein TonB|nr:TonB family protein [Treponema sp.]
MKNRTRKPLLFFLGVSVLIHGGILGLAPVKARPGDNSRNQEQRVTLVNIPLPTPPKKVSPPPPQRPAVSAAPETLIEAPRETVPVYEGPAGEDAPEETSGPPVWTAVDPVLREDAISRYLAMIRGLIDKRKNYPYQARRQEQEGTVLIRFTVTRQGRLAGEPAVEKKSRHERLNASAIEAVKNAAPYPPFPGEIGDDEMIFQVAVNFSLR